MPKCASLPMADCCKRGTLVLFRACLLHCPPSTSAPRLSRTPASLQFEPCELFQATGSSFIFSQRISEAGALTLYQKEKRFEVAQFCTKWNMPFLSLTPPEMQEKALFREGARTRDQCYALQPHTVEKTQTGTDFFSCSRSEHAGASWRFRD